MNMCVLEQNLLQAEMFPLNVTLRVHHTRGLGYTSFWGRFLYTGACLGVE